MEAKVDGEAEAGVDGAAEPPLNEGAENAPIKIETIGVPHKPTSMKPVARYQYIPEEEVTTCFLAASARQTSWAWVYCLQLDPTWVARNPQFKDCSHFCKTCLYTFKLTTKASKSKKKGVPRTMMLTRYQDHLCGKQGAACTSPPVDDPGYKDWRAILDDRNNRLMVNYAFPSLPPASRF